MSPSKKSRAEAPSVLAGEQRINKLLAAAGLGSRRQVDELIKEGRVEIDGKTVTQVGIKVDANASKISVDGEPLKRHRPAYFAVYKPAGVLCTNRDPEGRPRVIDLVPAHARLFPVGRLDASSTGLILLTNDGELAQRLAHPRHSVPKTYYVVVAGQVEPEAMRRLQRGIHLAEGFARVDGAKIRRVRKGCTEIDITLSEGKNREIRRVLARLGHKVVTLRRQAIGPLRLADLPEGAYRPLSTEEVAALYQAVENIKREKKQERKERDKKRAAEMSELAADNAEQVLAPESEVSKAGKPPKKAKGKKNKKGQELQSTNWDDQADEMLESLPPMSMNPYRQPDDEEDADDGEFDDAVLIKDTGAGMDISTRKGKVLNYQDDEDDLAQVLDEDQEGDDPTGMGLMQFDDEEFDDDESHEKPEAMEDDDAGGYVQQPMPTDSPWHSVQKSPRPSRGRPARTGGDRAGGRGSNERGSRRPSGRSRGEYSERRTSRREGDAPQGADRPARGRSFTKRASSPTGERSERSSGLGGARGQRPTRKRGASGPPRSRSGYGPSATGRGEGRGAGDGASRGRPTGRKSSGKRAGGGERGKPFGGPKGRRGGGKGRPPRS